MHQLTEWKSEKVAGYIDEYILAQPNVINVTIRAPYGADKSVLQVKQMKWIDIFS